MKQFEPEPVTPSQENLLPLQLGRKGGPGPSPMMTDSPISTKINPKDSPAGPVAIIRRQYDSVKQGGPRAVLRKASLAARLLLAVLPLLVVRALRPLVVIRFGQIYSDRIGKFASEPEIYLSERDAGMHGGRVFDVFYFRPDICNHQLAKMWKPRLRIFQPARPVGLLNGWLPGGTRHEVPKPAVTDRDVHGVLARTRTHLQFTPEEEARGQAGLRALGIPEGVPFMCFHARDPAYAKNLLPYFDGSYMDYRNSNIANYLPAMEMLSQRGYYAIRMGAAVSSPLKTSNSMVIDYASTARTEFLDIYLSAKCAFFMTTTAGLEKVPMAFRRPCAVANYVPMEHLPTWGPDDICIPKKLWLRKEERYITFREIMSSDLARTNRTHLYEQMGIDVVENTPDEITGLALEMDERLKGTWQSRPEDEELQERFWSLYQPSEYNGVFYSRVGAAFLRNNIELLD